MGGLPDGALDVLHGGSVISLPMFDDQAPADARVKGWLRDPGGAIPGGITLGPAHSPGRIDVPIPADTPPGPCVLEVRTLRFLSAVCPADRCDVRLRAQLVRPVTVE